MELAACHPFGALIFAKFVDHCLHLSTLNRAQNKIDIRLRWKKDTRQKEYCTKWRKQMIKANKLPTQRTENKYGQNNIKPALLVRAIYEYGAMVY